MADGPGCTINLNNMNRIDVTAQLVSLGSMNCSNKFENSFENTQRRKVKQMQPVWTGQVIWLQYWLLGVAESSRWRTLPPDGRLLRPRRAKQGFPAHYQSFHNPWDFRRILPILEISDTLTIQRDLPHGLVHRLNVGKTRGIQLTSEKIGCFFALKGTSLYKTNIYSSRRWKKSLIEIFTQTGGPSIP